MAGQKIAQRIHPSHLCFSLEIIYIAFIYQLFARRNHNDAPKLQAAQGQRGQQDVTYAISGHFSICTHKKYWGE